MQLQVPQLSLIDQRGIDPINNLSFMHTNDSHTKREAFNLEQLKLDFPPKKNQRNFMPQKTVANTASLQNQSIQQPFPKSLVDSQTIKYGKLTEQNIPQFSEQRQKYQQSKLSLVDIDAMYSDNFAIKQEIKDLRQQNNDIIVQIAQQKSRLLNLNNERRRDDFDLNKAVRESNLKQQVSTLKQLLHEQQEQYKQEEREKLQNLIEKHKFDKIVDQERRRRIQDEQNRKNQQIINKRKIETSQLQQMKQEMEMETLQSARENARAVRESLTHTFQSFHDNRRNMIRTQVAADLISQKESIVREIEINQETLQKLRSEVQQLEKEVMDNKIRISKQKQSLK